ncbi:hypothetical protein [Streptomyces koyangensis]
MTPLPPAGELATLLAHGVGSRHDLPVSPFYAFAGAFAALLVSFLGLGLLWSRSRFTGDAAGRPLPAAVQRCADARATTLALRALGLAAFLTVLAHLLLGPDDPARNPAPASVYALFWAGLVPLSLLCGPLWRRLNPLRTLHLLGRALLRRPEPDRPPPAWLGLWPAALGLLAFTWLELASPAPASRTALLAFLGAYTVLQLAAAARWGEAWFARGDAFEAYAGLLARLSPFGRRADGRLVVRNPLDGLDATERVPGLAATLCVLLGSTAYDGFSGTAGWTGTLQTSPLGPVPTATLGLLAVIGVTGAVYALCTAATRVPGAGAAFAHSLVPVALGYLVAHYFTLFTTEAPRALALAVGAAPGPVPEPPLEPGGLAALQVCAVVTGHVLGVVAAHDRAVRLQPPERAVSGQIPLLVLMITYTLGGLGLLVA